MDGVWENVVSEFHKKEFTVKTDKLAAILGVASRFESLDHFGRATLHPSASMNVVQTAKFSTLMTCPRPILEHIAAMRRIWDRG
jgi:hypothetical protein